jgi:hypothetical protein
MSITYYFYHITEPINAGDMIIEYRGELIGIAMADKREIEYERQVVLGNFISRPIIT